MQIAKQIIVLICMSWLRDITHQTVVL